MDALLKPVSDAPCLSNRRVPRCSNSDVRRISHLQLQSVSLLRQSLRLSFVVDHRTNVCCAGFNGSLRTESAVQEAIPGRLDTYYLDKRRRWPSCNFYFQHTVGVSRNQADISFRFLIHSTRLRCWFDSRISILGNALLARGKDHQTVIAGARHHHFTLQAIAVIFSERPNGSEVRQAPSERREVQQHGERRLSRAAAQHDEP